MTARRLYDYTCASGHKTEAYTYTTDTVIPCGVCGAKASRLISPARIKLEGITGAFPTAYDAWTRMHENGARKRSQQEE